MKSFGPLLLLMLAATPPAFSQTSRDSSFSLLFNSGISFTHANDPHINRWLSKYGYPTEPHVPASVNLELAAIPAHSRLLYSIRLSTITSGNNLSSYNAVAGMYYAFFKTPHFLLFAGGSAGLHGDIITLNGNLPPAYKEMAASHPEPLALRRRGLVLEPGVRAFWYPVHIRNVQVGAYAGLGVDMDFNSRWRLGYYSNNHGKYAHFRGLGKPSDQTRVSEYGLLYNMGLSVRLHLY